MSLVYSLDGMVCKEVKAYEKRIMLMLAKKVGSPMQRDGRVCAQKDGDGHHLAKHNGASRGTIE